MTMRCHRLLLLKHKEEGDNSNCHCLFHYNITKVGDNGAMPLISFSQT